MLLSIGAVAQLKGEECPQEFAMVTLSRLMLMPESLHVRGLEVTLPAQECGRQQVPGEIAEVAHEPFRHWDVKAFFTAM